MKFRRNIYYVFQIIERTQFCDGQTDGRKGKTICLPTLPGWRHNYHEHEKSLSFCCETPHKYLN